MRFRLPQRLKGPLDRLGRMVGLPLPRRRETIQGEQPSQTPLAPINTPMTAPILERLRVMQRDFEQATARLGFIGESGSGKSSLINAIVGQPVAAVGALIETTQQA